MALCALLLCALVVQALGDVYTYPVKSINLDNAPAVEFYTANDGASLNPVGDLHAVHGIETSDGGYVLVGKGIESEETAEAAIHEAFAVRLDSAGQMTWAWRSGVAGGDAANAVAQVSDTHIAVVGWRTVGTQGRRCITQLKLSDGTEEWTADDLGDSDQTGAYEMIEMNGDDVYLSGLHKKGNTDEMAFKSYGNVADGVAVVQKFSKAKLAGGTKVVAADAVWETEFSGYMSAKAARVVGDDLAVLLYAEDKAKHASLTVLDPATGAARGNWATPKHYSENTQGEGTDIQAAGTNAVVISGHGTITTGIPGRMSKINLADGSVAWQKQYSVGGTPTLIFNECWGVVAMRDGSGFALSCGAGIEECESVSAEDKADCDAGRGDKRDGAYIRKAGVWYSYVVRTDAEGEVIWQRVDSYKEPGGADLGAAGWDPTSSAAEWIIQTQDGGLAAVQDEVFGVGLMKLATEEGSTPAPTTADASPAPTTAAATPAPPSTPAPPTPPSPTCKYCSFMLGCDMANETCEQVRQGEFTGQSCCVPGFAGAGGLCASMWMLMAAICAAMMLSQ
eukprot:TRINITY_DN3265_c0_g1_i14.p1 TRINITY_DN3265_c0_g1~~TRINITY_DN3265_c0_g1_i14.p1  ORF type:complete len:564 (+),score=190.12 TRINITY_DN3265_c0_g1_i14:51-1742(+)